MNNKGNILLPIISAIAVLALVAAGYFFYQTQIAQPQPVVKKSTTLTPVPSVTKAKTRVPTTIVKSDPNFKTYQSKSLGVSFNYLTKSDDDNNYAVGVKEEGNKIYVYQQTNYSGYKEGQWVEVFSKEKNQTLADAIKKRFLANYSPSDCFVNSYQYGPNKYPTNFELASIDVPKTESEGMDTLFTKWEKCPTTYTSTNGLSYFLMDPNHPEKFVYFSIGQYAIMSGTENIPWQDTIKFL